MQKTILLLLSLCFSFTLFSQKQKVKFGKVGKDVLEMKSYAADPNASAVILYDYDWVFFSFQNGHFTQKRRRHIRIKIFKNDAFYWADWTIPLQINGNAKEKLVNLKAYTFNLDKNGKITKTKLSKKSIFDKEVHSRLNTKKFSLPEVKEGSVIDISYSITSDFSVYIRPHYFQYEIPVKYSEYTVDIPEFFVFKKKVTGYIPMQTFTQETLGDVIIIKQYNKINNVDISKERYHFIATDVEAFIEEEPMTSKNNYISIANFDFTLFKPRYGINSDYSSTWQRINKELLSYDDFNLKTFRGGFLNGEIERIESRKLTELEKAKAAHQFIKDRMKWNEIASLYTYHSLRSSFNNGSGNSADINLMLVLMLKKLGLRAEPVILKQRQDGFMDKSFPSTVNVRYVIASVIIDSTRVLLDATSKFLPIGMLPVRALNHEGLIVSRKNSGWADLTPKQTYSITSNNTLILTKEGKLSGEFRCAYKGYAALNKREEIQKEENAEKLFKESSNTEYKITDYKIINFDKLEEPLKEEYHIESTNIGESNGDILYFTPLFDQAITENPFKLKKRVYPIEYPYKKDITRIVNITIPDGYKVEEFPEQALVTLPENGGKFLFQVTQIGNTLQIVSKLSIKKELFVPEDYLYLKEFYNIIIAKHAEQIVLVKK